MLENISILEEMVLNAIFKVNNDNLSCRKIKQQLKSLKVKNRTFTGVGFYTEFIVYDETLIVDKTINIELGGIDAEIDGLNHGAGFILWVKDGLIEILEGYCYDESWPVNAEIAKLFEVKMDGSLHEI